MKHYFFLCLISVGLVMSSGCQHFSDTSQDTLYQDLGERKNIARVVRDMLYLIVDDQRINQHFKGIDVRQFQTNLTDQLCELSGGPCTYTGMNMREAHQGMGITDTEFNAVAEHLIVAMEKNGISTSAQNRLLKRLIPTYPDIRTL